MKAKPLFVINFKAYDRAYGPEALKLAKQIEEAAKIKGVPVILCVPATEIVRISAGVKVPVFGQHTDPITAGAHTGWLSPEMLVAAGAKGTLINHSEHRLGEDVEQAVALAKQAGLQVIVCAKDATEVKILRNLPADYIAVEPPELIAGEVSVATAKPELITQASKHCPDRLLVGAGVKTHHDVVASMEHGAKGVLLASGVMKAKDVKAELFELFGGW